MPIETPNDWMRKAGARVEANALILPLKCIQVPMTIASEAVEKFEKDISYNSRIGNSIIIAHCLRIAEEAYFRFIANELNEKNKHSAISVCYKCIRNQLYDMVCLKKYRDLCNQYIIHAMKSGDPIQSERFNHAIDYYNEFLKLLKLSMPAKLPKSEMPTMGQIVYAYHFPSKTGLSFCEDCLKKMKQKRK